MYIYKKACKEFNRAITSHFFIQTEIQLASKLDTRDFFHSFTEAKMSNRGRGGHPSYDRDGYRGGKRGRGGFRGRGNGRGYGAPRKQSTFDDHTYADRYIPSDKTKPRKDLSDHDIIAEPVSAEKQSRAPGAERNIIIRKTIGPKETRIVISKPKIAYTVRVELDDEVDITGVFLDYSKAVASAEEVMALNDDDLLDWNSRGGDFWSLNGNSVSIQTWNIE